MYRYRTTGGRPDPAVPGVGARGSSNDGPLARRLIAERGWRLAILIVAALSLAGCSGAEGIGWDSGSVVVPISDANDFLVPTAVETSLRFTDLAVGLAHACGVTASGQVYCWGSDEYGQLGSEEPMALCDAGSTRCSSTPVRVASNESFMSVAGSLRHSCALTKAGTAWCWGYGEGGQLGDGLGVNSETPVPVMQPTQFSSIALGGSGLIGCAITVTGGGMCWGPGGGGGGLGDGTTDGSNAPVAIQGGLTFSELAVGDDQACGIAVGGAGYCWGHNGFGKLGQGAPGASSVPSAIAGGLSFVQISAGLNHTCGLIADGGAYCWGVSFTVGSKVTDTDVFAPVAVAGGRHFKTLSAGQDHTCALDAAGAAWCWGTNYNGVLGDGTREDRVQPVAVATTLRFKTIRAGGGTCALTASGQAYCWGSNKLGLIGRPPAS